LSARNEGTDQREVRSRRSSYALIGVVALVLVGMCYLYFVYPGMGIGPVQPVYFSHRVHAGVKAINCRFCHPNVERSENAGLPPLEKCFFCHKYVIPEHPEVRAFWVPDFVFFNHVPHVRRAKLDCTTCHGHVEQFDRLNQVKLKMNFCITCHRLKGAQLDCWLACHR
jgi:hypothetical protein